MYKTIASLILASQSPRRHQLLSQMGIKYTLARADIEEIQKSFETAPDFVIRMAQEKALAVASDYFDAWILTADTIVVLDDEILGKPISEPDACTMLSRLAGRWHHVFTAFTLQNMALSTILSQVDSSRVKISPLSKPTIAAYVASGEPLDKAGSYAVQGIGGAFVEAIEGSPTTVIGLPLHLVIEQLSANKIISLK